MPIFTDDTFARARHDANSGWGFSSDGASWTQVHITTRVMEHPAQKEFDLLGVSPRATADEIRAAFREKVRAIHPDAGGRGGNADALTKAKEITLQYARANDETD